LCTSYKSIASEPLVAVRTVSPGAEWRALRALQLLFFNTPMLPDDDAQIAEALDHVEDGVGLSVGQADEGLDEPAGRARQEAGYFLYCSAAGGKDLFRRAAKLPKVEIRKPRRRIATRAATPRPAK